MGILYDLASYISYFLVMIVFMIIAIIIAKHKSAAWCCYGIGAGLQLLSLIGNQKTANFYGTSMTTYWVIYFVLLAISAMIIVDRYEKLIRK